MRLAGVLVVFLVLSGASVAAVGSGPFVVVNDTFYVKPTFTFELSSARRNSMIGKTQWLSWSATGASARTTLFTNTCRPNCGEGSFQKQPAQVRFYNLATCRGKKVFSDFVISAVNGEPLLSGSFRSLGYLRHC
jgi:hypothetical protein